MFLSHTWKADCLGRNTHRRVASIHRALVDVGQFVWFDEDVGMSHDIDGCMAEGIERCDVFVVFITRAYCEKVERAARDPLCQDNCYKEFSYASCCKKAFLPVVFEPTILESWPQGIVKMHCGNKMYVDGTMAEPNEIASEIVAMHNRLRRRSRSKIDLRTCDEEHERRCVSTSLLPPLPPIEHVKKSISPKPPSRPSSRAQRKITSSFRLPSLRLTSC